MKHIIWRFLVVLLLFSCLSAKADLTFNKDSLLMELKNLPDSLQLKQLDGQARINAVQSRQRGYIDLLLSEAIRVGDKHYQANALFLMAQYYYLKNPDSMRYFIKQAEPLLLSEDRKDDLFRLRGWNIFSLTYEGKRDSVLPEVEAMKAYAEKLNFQDGKDMANQALANFYVSTGFAKEGVRLYEEVLASMEKRNVPMVKRVYVLRQLLNKDLEREKRVAHLELLHSYIQECEQKGITKLDDVNSIEFLKYIYHRIYALHFYNEGNAANMYRHLKIADELEKQYKLEKDRSVVMELWVYYYRLTKNYDQAVHLSDELIHFFMQNNQMMGLIPAVERKSEILYKQGKGLEAMDTYRQYTALKDSLTTSKYLENLAELRAQHDLDALELKNKEMELEATSMHVQLLTLGGGLFLMILACGFLGFIAYSRHRYGIQLKKAKEKAEESDRLKSAFLANMNHEIRTPLNAIVGFSQVLVDEEDMESRQEYFEIIQRNNELLQRLITDVLDLSKIESSNMAFLYEKHDLPKLMKDIFNITKLRMPDGVQLELNNCPSLLFCTDRNRLTQILTNLLTNAIKHTHSGFIRFGYEVSETDVKFYISDTGAGIPADKLESIFSRFVQLDEWTKGVGLGLAICKGLISQMGGTISVESQVGVGSIFFVTLPRKEE